MLAICVHCLSVHAHVGDVFALSIDMHESEVFVDGSSMDIRLLAVWGNTYNTQTCEMNLLKQGFTHVYSEPLQRLGHVNSLNTLVVQPIVLRLPIFLNFFLYNYASLYCNNTTIRHP